MNTFKKIYSFFIGLFYSANIDRRRHYFKLAKSIGWRHAWGDFFAIFRKLGIFFLFNVVALIAFCFTPQGQDVLLCVVEDSQKRAMATLVFLVFGILYWTITSELGCRMQIYFNDNSKADLSDERKRFKKMTQRLLPKIAACIPSLIVALAFTLSYINHETIKDRNVISILKITGVFAFISLVIYGFYFNEKSKLRLRFYKLKFSRRALRQLYSLHTIIDEPLAYAKEPLNITHKKANYSKLKYSVVFKPLYKRHMLLLIMSAILILLLSMAPLGIYAWIGTSGLIALAFGCWITIIYSIAVLDMIQPFKIKLPYRLIVLIWVIVVSITNSDHPLREYDNTNIANTNTCDNKKLKTYFKEWIKYQMETKKGIKWINPLDSTISPILIAAEGGASRTGCFTTMMLSTIQEKYPELKDKIFCYSSVSGGTIGTNIFNVFNKLPIQDTSYVEASMAFYNEDFLAPVIGKLCFAEIINYFYPKPIENFDRAIALEKSWENALSEKIVGDKPNTVNPLARPFMEVNKPYKNQAVLLINTTEIETGQRAIISNIDIDDSYITAINFKKQFDKEFRYSTAMGLSARFPIVSPTGMVVRDDSFKRHYADGGYYENTGALTLSEAFKAIYNDTIRIDSIVYRIKPKVIQFLFDSDGESKNNGISVFNELMEVLNGIYNVRSGHANEAYENMRLLVNDTNMITFNVGANGKEVPMNWVLSSNAITILDSTCQKKLKKEITKLDSWFK